jgi:NAD(P)-dependent dehydrogenase (short-subunit alcohol dehydrogenase family)
MHSPIDYQPPLDLLKDKVILVTGAGQGIGEAVALSYARHGATLILLGRNEKKLAKVYDAITALGAPQPAAMSLDLAKVNESDLEKMVDLLTHEFGRLDGMVHNAHASIRPAPLMNQKLDEWITLFRVNTAMPFALTRACLPLLKQSKDASVILTGETHAMHPKAYWGAYSISKAGLPNFLAIAASEWDNLPHFRINLLIPGPVHSPFRTKTHPGETREELPSISSLLPSYLYWMGKDSHGRSGEIISCVQKS